MSRSGVQLKVSAGWFAAGIEVQRAATLLSDGAFKLYVWLCLHAQRDLGCLQVSADDLAAALRKTEDELRDCLLELHRAGVCQCGPAGRIRICDCFWPYVRTEPSIWNGHDTECYVSRVKGILLARSCVSTAFTPADARIAAEWCRSGVSLEAVERAIQLGCLRKYAALINHGSGTPITTLGYFRSLIEEVTHSSASVEYWRYVSMRLGDLERRWRRHREQSSQETK
jgi:hypothetical protein